jgi:hypothetical protein
LVSDGDPNLATLVPMMTGSAWSNITILTETGSAQDVTSALGLPSGVTANATSDVEVVPEPGTSALLLAGLGLLGWCARASRRV